MKLRRHSAQMKHPGQNVKVLIHFNTFTHKYGLMFERDPKICVLFESHYSTHTHTHSCRCVSVCLFVCYLTKGTVGAEKKKPPPQATGAAVSIILP